jgi:electron transport complex protein RnfE|tara:strand:+ start:2457 stop:3068 length:612 start_codon:yes stop_codon:yes gene_type:complete
MYVQNFLKGLWKQNPIFRLILGMCPTLAVTNAAINGLAMGLATLFVLVSSALIVSLIRNWIPSKVRIPSFIVIIATFVTIADYILAATVPPIHKVLGIYVPLIVVNCIILGRMEAFASKNSLINSLIDAFGMGIGFTLGLIILGSVREILGFGTLFGITLLGSWYPQMLIMKLPTGAFVTLGLLIALMNVISRRKTAQVKESG